MFRQSLLFRFVRYLDKVIISTVYLDRRDIFSLLKYHTVIQVIQVIQVIRVIRVIRFKITTNY